MGIIYLLVNKKNCKAYVGLDSRGFRNRLKEHFRQADNNEKPKLLIEKAMKKYFPENFEYNEIDETSDINKLKELEKFYIQLFNTYVYTGYGYNLTKGGDGCFGFKMPLDKVHKGITHYKYGKHLTEAERKQRSISMQGKNAGDKNVFKRPEVRALVSKYAKKRIGRLNPNYKHGNRMGVNKQ